MLPGSSIRAAGATSELCLQLPHTEDPRDEVVRSLPEPVLSSLTTLNGFSRAFRTFLMRGRLVGLELRHDLATIAMAHTSSKRSSSYIKEGSTIFVTSSLS
uniref:Uncharacterized protein n=1 Tax=Opuntia streptacantha TaxID=393608 RepID=A0A7C9AHX1_OPUST